MSNTTILLIGHGSRNPAGNVEFLAFAERLKKRMPQANFVTCFIEFHEVLVGDGIDQAVAQGADRIIAIPVILLAAGHVKMEIPEILAEGRERHPGVTIEYGRNIGVCDATVTMLHERVNEAVGEAIDPDTGVLVLGRGSSDPDANGDLAKIARLYREKSGYDLVNYGFVGITQPDLPTGMEQLIRMGAKRVVIAPYFLFTGVLMERIRKIVAETQTAHPDVDFTLAGYFEFHEQLLGVIESRIREAQGDAMMMMCDTCEYRIEAAEHGDHHHHHH